ncbi:MAG: Lsm family RNA-binding protein [Candidatus Bathyarchaeota archaeon]|jgi:small nuclear ribonucleoprotein (snRNP)-like protein
MAQRKFFAEVASLVDTNVIVVTTSGKTYSGTLAGIHPDNLSLCLAEAKDEEGKTLHRACINGKVVAQIFSVEKPFDLEALAKRLEKVFPTMVKHYQDQGFIWVMNKVKVSEKGVEEGSGPAAERVQRVYEQFISDVKG